MLKGYKTYITGVLTILGAIGAFLTGEAALADTIQLCVTAILGMTIRNGIANS